MITAPTVSDSVSFVDGLDKTLHQLVILPSLRIFDTAGNVDSKRMHFSDSLSHVLGPQTAGQNDATKRVGTRGPRPLERVSRSSRCSLTVGIEKQSRHRVLPQAVHLETVLHTKSFDDLHAVIIEQ